MKVSYKWLSRNFSVSSDDAKRLLQEFVTKHGSELKVIYTLSGWLKKDPGIYNVRLVSGSKLAEFEQEYLENYSVQVYSVQTCIPKDSAVLWSAEFVQAEELFDQPATTDNCLRDNRFCGVANSSVKRIANEKFIIGGAPKNKTAKGMGMASKLTGTSPSSPIHQQDRTEQPKPTNIIQNSAAVNMHNNDDTAEPSVHSEASKAHVGKEKASDLLTTKKAVIEKAPQKGNTGSLANLWGRASAKLKPHSSTVDSNKDILKASAATADAQICAREALDSVSSDEGKNNGHKESSGRIGRKRRVVFDFSDDDEENIVSLASPEPLNDQISKEGAELERINLKFEDQISLDIKLENASDSTLSSKQEFENSQKNEASGNAVTDKAKNVNHENHTESRKRDTVNNSVSTSPKRKKILKTRIDERGREVTEVVWEGGAAETNKTTIKAETVATDNGSETRLPPADKPVASRVPSFPAPSKTGNTKTTKTAKDSKQANILSFFKKA